MLDKEAWKEQSGANARSLESEINRLQNDHGDLLGLFWHQYDEFWAHARRISTMFKTPLFREDRERLWAAYSTVCEEMKRTQAREREARLNDSREKRDLVMSKIHEAYFQAKGAASSAEFAEADALLGEALAWMRNGWEGFNTVTQLISPILSSGIMTRDDREECWTEWKEAQELLRLRRDEYYAEVRARRIGRMASLGVRERIEAKSQKLSDLESRNEQPEKKIAEIESRLAY